MQRGGEQPGGSRKYSLWAAPRPHCLAFFRMVPTAEITVVLVPLAVVVTETTAGSVAVVVMMVGCARVAGIAESHLLFLFWASAAGHTQGRAEVSSRKQTLH